MRADRLTLVLHDDTEAVQPDGSSYHLTRAGVQVVTPDGVSTSWPAWDVLRVEADNDRKA